MNNFSANATRVLAANVHCRPCNFNFFYDVTRGINIVFAFDDGSLKGNDPNNPFFYSQSRRYVGNRINIWCPKCSRLETGKVYIPKRREIKNVSRKITQKHVHEKES